jgi:flagellar biosynthesis protein FlhB
MSDTPDNDQKTQAPTAKRRADAAREGDILQSRELGTALVMIFGAIWVAMAGPWFIDCCQTLLRAGLSFNVRDFRDFDPFQNAISLISIVVFPLVTLFGLSIVAAIAAPSLLGSFGFRAGAFNFKASRINPGAGLKRIFGTQGLIELGKALAKTAVLGGIGYWLVSRSLNVAMSLGTSDLHAAVGLLGNNLVSAIIYMTLGLALIAFIDVPAQIFTRNARLRMSLQEVKQEMRESDGAPELKQAVRQRQHSILMGSARKSVAEATVVLVNPTHFAIALRYKPGTDYAPIVVARGRGETALAIKTLATENGIPILEYPRLTRAIYFTSRSGQVIAEDLFIAVATILAFVFNLEQATADGVSPPNVTVPAEKSFNEFGEQSTR